jgi:ribulose 1,5-bisphosphate synthetase/thiazole synthase
MSSNYPSIGQYDVAVVGAGPSGFGAAVTAARMGLNTILIEKYGSPGGVASNSCCPIFFGFDIEGKQAIGSLADEVIRCLDKDRNASLYLNNKVRFPEYLPIGERSLSSKVISTVNSIRNVYNRMLDNAGVNRLFHSHCFGAETVDSKIKSIFVDCLEGPGKINAQVFVDATGDAHLVHRAGGKTRTASVEESMHKSLFFEVGGVTPYDLEYNDSLYHQLFEAGKTPSGILCYFAHANTLQGGVTLISMAKAIGDGVNSADMTRMDAEMREQIPQIIDFLRKKMPGFTNCYLVSSAFQVGVRAGRSIVGRETIDTAFLSNDFISNEPIAFIKRNYGSHSIAKEKFHPSWANNKTGTCAIPMKALIPVDFDNVITCGRAISADPRILDTIRMMAICMTTGQVAGILGKLAIHNKQGVPEVPYAKVREKMLEMNNILDF